MKKALFIIGGSLLVLLLAAIWLYVMFIGTPTSIDEIFNGFAGDDTPLTDPLPPVATTTPEEPRVNVNGEALRQLTTKPIIGFREVQATTSSAAQVFYAEAGTGHIYSIDLQTGTERRVSGTTIAEARKADFTDDGQYVTIVSGYGTGQKTYLGSISTSSESLTQIPFQNRVEDFTITPAGTLLYTVREAVTSGRAYTFTTGRDELLFTLPFREAMVSWGQEKGDAHYAYPKPAHLLEGFLYKIKNGTLSRMPVAGYGLNVFTTHGIIGISRHQGQVHESYFLNEGTQTRTDLRLLPEKCTGSRVDTSRFWCASGAGPTGFDFPDTWYSGELSFKDSLYALELTGDFNSITLLVDTFKRTNRDIDIIDLSLGKSENRLYFINKNDQTLWTYDLTQ